MIREATMKDIPEMCALLEVLHINTPYRHIRSDIPTIANALYAMLHVRNGFIRVAEHKGKLTGILFAQAQRFWWVDQKQGAKLVSDMVFYSQKYGDGRKLLKALVDWSMHVPGVVRIEMSISSGQPVKLLRKLYEGAGLHQEGTLFVLNHPNYERLLRGDRDAA